jgi:hypothetical protein
MTAEKILEEIAIESGFDTWETYIECFSTTEHGRRVINKGVLKAVNQALILHPVSKSSTCENCDGWGYTVDENGRRDKHCDVC